MTPEASGKGDLMRTALFAFLMSSGIAWADDVALVIGNEAYENGQDVSAADDVYDAARALTEAGFRVTKGADLTAAQMRDLVPNFATEADGSGRVAIVLAGHFVHVGSEVYLLGSDAEEPDLGTLGTQGLSLDVLSEIAARSPGGAVLVLGQGDVGFSVGEGVGQGLIAPSAPQGVTVITGDASDVAEFVDISLPFKGITLKRMLIDYPGLKARGFLSSLVAFLPKDGTAAVQPVTTAEAKENARWRTTQSIGTKEAFENYLTSFPKGRYAKDAKAALAEIEAQPQKLAEAGEAALKLKRNDRRQVQRNLSLLEFDPRGIDGIFGRGSRAAITKWQQVNGEDATGYLTNDQIVRLQAQADKRAAQLEAEAAKRQKELERQDRNYWRATGQLGDEAGLRAYLERYPDGSFAEVALARLEPFEAARREQAAAQDRAAWDAAVSVDSEAAYRGYLQANPDGAFADQAKARLSELEFQRKNAAALQAAERNEARLGLNPSTRQLVEGRLNALGLKPGKIDGTFDKATRRAIRRYQEVRKLQMTGFLNQATLVRLLADSVLK